MARSYARAATGRGTAEVLRTFEFRGVLYKAGSEVDLGFLGSDGTALSNRGVIKLPKVVEQASDGFAWPREYTEEEPVAAALPMVEIEEDLNNG